MKCNYDINDNLEETKTYFFGWIFFFFKWHLFELVPTQMVQMVEYRRVGQKFTLKPICHIVVTVYVVLIWLFLLLNEGRTWVSTINQILFLSPSEIQKEIPTSKTEDKVNYFFY